MTEKINPIVIETERANNMAKAVLLGLEDIQLTPDFTYQMDYIIANKKHQTQKIGVKVELVRLVRSNMGKIFNKKIKMPDAQPSLPVLIFYIDSTTQKGLFELVNHNSPSAIEHDIFPLTTSSLKNTIHTVWSDTTE